MTAARTKFEDVQGVIVRGYGKSVPYKRHRIFTIVSVPGAQSFLAALLSGGAGPLHISDATTVSSLVYRLNVAITYQGFVKLDPSLCKQVDDATTQIFSPFKRGAYDTTYTAPTVGDILASDPSQWWGARAAAPGVKPPANEDLHLVVSLYANSPELRDQLDAALDAMIPGSEKENPALAPAFSIDSDPLAIGDVPIHFGYSDGFSQPFIDGWTDLDPEDDRPQVPAWRFVIGPVPTGNSPPAGGYVADSFLYNGSFAAFRMLYQDVGAFEAYIAQNPRPELLAAKMCGRWRDGTPLVVSPDSMDASLHGLELTNFQYLAPSAHQLGPRLSDPNGELCPYAAHIRRTNPRDDTAVTGNFDDVAQLHRIVRRANAYGTAYSEKTKDELRGLVGYFINADLSGQFEFLMGQWIGAGGFRSPDRSPDESQSGVDPLFGPKSVNDYPNFYYAGSDGAYLGANGQPWSTSDQPLSNFIRTDGAMYVFIPSITALERLAGGGGAAVETA